MLTREQRVQILLEDFGGILPHAENFYLVFIKSRLDAAIDCEANFQRFCQSRRHETAVLWLIQALSHASAVSRFMWPPRTKDKLHSARGDKLRVAFGLSDSSALNDRTLRDTLEHLDERLDDYFLKDLSGVMVPFLVDNSDPREDQKCHLFAYVNPSEEYVVILDRQYSYKPIFEELHTLKPILDAAYKRSRL